ncbi:serine hydrolase domain-containing protein [Sandaracinobacteroides hominis]|uniref:serine hydrolase domain-containing protein n=1 Tax=Sandaracinobacteroides hominis TaxID=2780086 RepID=UPI0018F3D4EB|nr:serine hydrolase domain-containing protein [Sandaracinobacteroides hominis]
MGQQNAISLDRRSLLAAIAAGAASASAPAFGRGSTHPAVQALLDAYVAEGLVPGAVVGIVRPGRFQPVWIRSGKTLFEGGVPVDPETLWRVYSMTKLVTGIAVMQQVAAGKLSIDTPIADVMPEFRQMRVLVDPRKGLDSRPATKPILVRHLLTHTAGFTYAFNQGLLEDEYKRVGLQPMSSGALLQQGAPAPDLTGYMQRLATLPLAAEPGSKWQYSISLDVAGALLERLTGKTLDRVFAEQLFEPLGMKDTGFWVSPAQQKRLAGLYLWRDSAWKMLDKPRLIDSAEKSDYATRPVMLAGGAGLVSSAENFARFAQLMLNEGLFEGRMLLPRGTARLAMANLMEPGVYFAETQGNGAGGRSVLYQSIGPNPESYNVQVWGWGGAASTLFHVDPVRQQAVVLMLQSLGNEKGPTEERLNRALASDAARQ